MKPYAKLIAAVTLATAFGAANAGAADPPALFTLSSPAFADNGVLPVKFAGNNCRGVAGGNLSPPLAWSNPPAGTKSFAIVMIDPDGQRGIGSVHWVEYGIPADRAGSPEGEGNKPPSPIAAGKNSRGTSGYTGPCGPSEDTAHHYVIDLIALDLAPGALEPGLERDAFLKAVKGHTLGPASLVVRYHNGG